MWNQRFGALSEFPFRRLAALLARSGPPADLPLADLSLGEPQHVLPGGVVYALQCERGEARMRVSLTDDAPPRIGGFEITRAPGTGPCG